MLEVNVSLDEGAHGLVTTPGATRFYRSEGAWACQRTTVRLAAGSRLEWLPLEALCFDSCRAENRLTLALDAGADLLGWDVSALGLPGAGQPFLHGILRQHIEAGDFWLERGELRANDRQLLDGPLGLAGHRCLATAFFVSGSAMERSRREAALEAARAAIDAHPLAPWAGATCPNERVVVVRLLAPLVEPAMQLLQQIRAAWRQALWQLPPTAPRIWAM